MLNVLFTRGLPDDNTVHATILNGRLEYFIDGCANTRAALSNSFRTAELLFVGRGPEIPVSYDRPPDVIFNEISDPDTHRISLARANAFCQHFSDVPVVNHPEIVARNTRDHLSRVLDDIDGIVMPKTIRAALRDPKQVDSIAREAELKYPLLVRIAGEHGGVSLVRIENADDISPLHSLPLDGRDFYVTEFKDFQSTDGLYRKYRIVVVDGRPHIRHLICKDDWLVHAADVSFSETRPELQKEERELIESFDETLGREIEATVRAIHRATELDYFGIDCNVCDDGRLLIFEVNANMNVLINTRPKPNVSEIAIERIVSSLTDAIERKVSGK